MTTADATIEAIPGVIGRIETESPATSIAIIHRYFYPFLFDDMPHTPFGDVPAYNTGLDERLSEIGYAHDPNFLSVCRIRVSIAPTESTFSGNWRIMFICDLILSR